MAKDKAIERSNLTPKQDVFCHEYLVDLNATQAAIRAGFSRKTASVIGYEYLRKPHIQQRVSEMQTARAERLEITADRVLKEWGKIAFASLGDYITVLEDGTAIVDLSEMTPDQAAALGEVTVDEYTEGPKEKPRQVKKIKIKLGDKKGALDSIAKFLGMFTNKELNPEGFKLIFSSVLDE